MWFGGSMFCMYAERRTYVTVPCKFTEDACIHIFASNLCYLMLQTLRYSIDFGKNEVEVLKHAANYLEPDVSEAFLELIATTQLKVVYQPYDWGLNY